MINKWQERSLIEPTLKREEEMRDKETSKGISSTTTGNTRYNPMSSFHSLSHTHVNSFCSLVELFEEIEHHAMITTLLVSFAKKKDIECEC